jgi:hypothetical protein
MATAGSVHGRIKLRDREPACESDLAMENVKFAPNAQLVVSRSEYEVLQQQLRNRNVSRPFKGCESTAPESVPSRPLPPDLVPHTQPTVVALAASFNEQANADAPPEVRAAVARDSQTLTGKAVSAVLNDMSNRLSQEVGKHLGAESGALVQQAASGGIRHTATPAPQPSGNTVTRTTKGIGGSLKRFFGGGKKAAPKPNGS